MSLHGLEKDRDEGLVLRWQPEGFLIEMAKQKVNPQPIVTSYYIVYVPSIYYCLK